MGIVASKFSAATLGIEPLPGSEYWWGYSLGVGLSGSVNPTKAKGVGDIFKALDKITAGAHQQYYYMIYGNGGDKLSDGKDASGWHWRNPIDPKDNQ